MKQHPIFPQALILASLALTASAFADDNPANPIPAADAAGADRHGADALPFIGVGTSNLPRFLSKHLKLPENSGVLVRLLAPDGPAAKAGITEDDVITKVDGTAVGSHQDLVLLIHSKHPGDQIAIEMIHEGSPATLNITLGTRPETVPDDAKTRLRNQLEKFGNGRLKLKIGPNAIPGNGIRFDLASSIHLMDPDGSIELKQTNGGKEVHVRDKDGKEAWSGPWDTEKDKAAAPPEVRKRIDKLNIQLHVEDAPRAGPGADQSDK